LLKKDERRTYHYATDIRLSVVPVTAV